ncbi:MAG: DUF2845 domain-containing protein [Polyangiales bacterium]
MSPIRASVLRLALCATAVLGASPAYADGMRCGTRLVSDGDPMYQVRSICGAPDAEAHRIETRTVRHWVSRPCDLPGQSRCGYFAEVSVQVAVDEWTYDFGPHQFIRHLVFEEQKLAKIASGGYGIKIE